MCVSETEQKFELFSNYKKKDWKEERRKEGEEGKKRKVESLRQKKKKTTSQINTNGNEKQWSTKCYTLWVPAKLPAKAWYSENTACGQKH